MPPARRSARNASSSTARRSTQPYTRADRHSSPGATRPSASVARVGNGKGPLRLTVKAPPSKLRQATSGAQVDNARPAATSAYFEQTSESDATPRPPGRRARAARNVRTVIETDTDDEEDEEDDEEEEEEDQDMDEEDDEDSGDEEEQDEDVDVEMDQELSANGESDEDAEGEDDDMIDHPPPPIIKKTSDRQGKPNVTVTAPSEGPLKSVEAKEMEDEDDEELSDLESDENEVDEDEEEEGDDDNDDTDMDASRSATPDLSKLTRRQRGYFEENNNLELLALSNEAQKKKHLTAEEHAMRRAEMARRRKNLSEKRNEEEKMDTINKLLKKPAPKRRTRQEILAAQQADATGTPGADDAEEEKPDPVFVRWTHSKHGSRIGVPDEWMAAPLGNIFRPGLKSPTSALPGSVTMVEEVS